MALSLLTSLGRLRQCNFFRVIGPLLLGCGVVFLLAACRPKRPYGVERLGGLQNFQESQVYLQDKNFLVTHDTGGYAVMSTMCTKDLTPLVMKQTPASCMFVSIYSDSRYDCRGRVLSGPASVNLPYYELRLDRGEIDGPVDTLYVWIGKEKPAAWRLKVG